MQWLILMLSEFPRTNQIDQQRDNDRQLRKAGRDIERERRKLEVEEKKLEAEIKKMAAAGNKEGCAILAKQLIQMRKQKTRTYAANSKVRIIGNRINPLTNLRTFDNPFNCRSPVLESPTKQWPHK